MPDTLLRVRESYFLASGIIGYMSSITAESRLSALSGTLEGSGNIRRYEWFWQDVERWSESRIPEQKRKNLTTVSAVAKYLEAEF